MSMHPALDPTEAPQSEAHHATIRILTSDDRIGLQGLLRWDLCYL